MFSANAPDEVGINAEKLHLPATAIQGTFSV